MVFSISVSLLRVQLHYLNKMGGEKLFSCEKVLTSEGTFYVCRTIYDITNLGEQI